MESRTPAWFKIMLIIEARTMNTITPHMDWVPFTKFFMVSSRLYPARIPSTKATGSIMEPNWVMPRPRVGPPAAKKINAPKKIARIAISRPERGLYVFSYSPLSTSSSPPKSASYMAVFFWQRFAHHTRYAETTATLRIVTMVRRPAPE